MGVWSQGETRVRTRLWESSAHICMASMSTSLWGDRMWGWTSSAQRLGWGGCEEPEKIGQQGGWQPRLRVTCFLGPCAGATMCVSLNWASSLASGGPSRSSAGSVTEPSVSCCPPSTFPTCIACGKCQRPDRSLHPPVGRHSLPCRERRCARGQSTA